MSPSWPISIIHSCWTPAILFPWPLCSSSVGRCLSAGTDKVMERWDARRLLNNRLHLQMQMQKRLRKTKGKKKKSENREEKGKRMSEEMTFWEKKKSCREGTAAHNSEKKWRLSGEDWQGTPPRTISASIARIPLRKQSSWECEVIDAANCLFSGLLLKRPYFHTKWMTRSEGSREKTRTDFSLGVLCCCARAKIKSKQWIIHEIWCMLLSDVCSRVVPNLNLPQALLQQVSYVEIIQWNNDFLWNQFKLLCCLCYNDLLSTVLLVADYNLLTVKFLHCLQICYPLLNIYEIWCNSSPIAGAIAGLTKPKNCWIMFNEVFVRAFSPLFTGTGTECDGAEREFRQKFQLCISQLDLISGLFV